MHEGVILEVGKPGDIFTNPQNERTRQFLQSVL
jgi:ABC-type histidine transport system ATPase subunit